MVSALNELRVSSVELEVLLSVGIIAVVRKAAVGISDLYPKYHTVTTLPTREALDRGAYRHSIIKLLSTLRGIVRLRASSNRP